MGKMYFFVRMERAALDNDVYRIEDLGSLEHVGLGTALDPEAVWAVLGTKLASTSAVRSRLKQLGFDEVIQDIRQLEHPDQGRAMAQQLALFH